MILPHLDLVRVTEAAAISASKLVGSGDKIKIDTVATDAMRERLNRIDFCGQIIIGEGIKDKSQGLFKGEIVGKKHIPFSWATCDIAVDPVEGTRPTSIGGPEALSVIAIGESGSLFSSDVFYMLKFAVGPRFAHLNLSLKDSIEQIIDKIGNQITVCLLNRPRHEGFIKEFRRLGCRIKLIEDCDVSAVLACCLDSSGVDLVYSIGGAPEGVISAVTSKCMRGFFQGMLVDTDGNPIDGKIYNQEDLAKGNVVFAATGITDGSILKGVKYYDNKPKTHSISMRSESGTIRFIETIHGN